MHKLPDIKTEFSQWYQEVIYNSELADQSPVRGCIVIRPYGYAIWENIQTILNKKIKDTGHQNCYFPLFIPESFLKKEAKHVEGFAPEVAVVSYAGGKELEERLIVRPTSETIIHYMFSKWIKSYRDLPLKLNQWANVVRWEMRTRPFLRTTEFLWQEGHTAHETYQEAHDQAYMMLNEYKDLIENYLAIPVVAQAKPDSERFAGADITMTVEGLMQDGKALQMGTSHMISQNFAKSFEILFQGRSGNMQYPFLTSWGVTTRLIGAIVMMHGDQKGLIIPPKIAPVQIVIVPILKGNIQVVLDGAKDILKRLISLNVKLDDDENTTPGFKYNYWEQKGVPLRIEIGPRDLASGNIICVNRVDGTKEQVAIDDNLLQNINLKLELIQNQIYINALNKRQAMWHKIAKLKDFSEKLELDGGFYQTGWCKRTECENIAKGASATIRCVLQESIFKTCFACDGASTHDILVAKSY